MSRLVAPFAADSLGGRFPFAACSLPLAVQAGHAATIAAPAIGIRSEVVLAVLAETDSMIAIRATASARYAALAGGIQAAGAARARPGTGAAQHGRLVPQDEQLRVLGRRGAAELDQPAAGPANIR
jgi:hypothetical protein